MNRIALLVAAGLVIAGCEKEPEKAPVVEKTPAVSTPAPASSSAPTPTPASTSAPANDFIAVRIDGKNLTRRDIVRNGKVVLQLNLNKLRKTKVQKREIKAMERYCKAAVSKEIARTAVARYVSDRKLSIPTNTVKSVTRRFERQYGAYSRKLKRRHNINDLKYMLGKNAFRADEMIREMALYEVMTNDVVQSAGIVITDEMVKERQELIKRVNVRAAATNEYIFAKATNVWRKIVAKELTFEEAASKFSEDEYIQNGCEWGCFTRDQLDGEDGVLALLPTIKTGDITPPVESDGGLAILRKDEDDSNRTYSFSRVFFRLPYFYDEETPEQARAALRELKTSELIRQTIKDNIAKLKIEYPNGTNLVWKLTSQDFK